MHSTLHYRHEIDGLRSVAVCAVILHHLDPAWLPGGFLGVDVFFVISGFLITSIIDRDLQARTFSLRAFWMRRIRRLYPALMAMVLAVTIAGNLILIDAPRRHLIREAISTVTSLSNFMFWGTNRDYSSPAASESPLLHTWSLSLEDQYYLTFPPLMIFLFRTARRRMFQLLLGLGALSLALSVGVTVISSQAAFYLLPTRLWELLMGSLLAISVTRVSGPAPATWRPVVATLTGLAMVVASLVFVAPGPQIPGWKPLIPCIGTVLFLRFAEASGFVRSCFEAFPLRFVGRISYSLYLWHWPVIVLSRGLSPVADAPGLVCLMFALAIASYFFIETPFRYDARRATVMLGGTSAALACSLIAVMASSQSPWLPPALADFASPGSTSRGERFEATELIARSQSGVRVGWPDATSTVVVVGSSHARVLCQAIALAVESRSGMLVSLATSVVGVTLITEDDPVRLKLLNEQRLQVVRELRPNLTIVAGRWEGESGRPEFRQALREQLTAMADVSQHVVVLCQVPRIALPDRYQSSLRKYLLAAERAGVVVELRPDAGVVEANAVVKSVVADLALPNVECIDPGTRLLTADGTVRVQERGEFLYSDEHHVNDRGAEVIVREALKSVLDRFLPEISPVGP